MTKVISWFRRVFASFGEETAIPRTNYADVVERSRCGDQNAIALITLTRKNAIKGSPLAKQSLAEILAYARKTTPKPEFGVDASVLSSACSIGADVDDIGPKLTKVASTDPHTAAVTVANSCNALALAKKLDGCLKNKAFRESFMVPNLGLLNKVSHEAQHAFLLGFVLGLATRIQMVRRPDTPLSVLSTNVAWELGE